MALWLYGLWLPISGPRVLWFVFCAADNYISHPNPHDVSHYCPHLVSCGCAHNLIGFNTVKKKYLCDLIVVKAVLLEMQKSFTGYIFTLQ